MYDERCINVVFYINFGLYRVFYILKLLFTVLCRWNLNLSFPILTFKPLNVT